MVGYSFQKRLRLNNLLSCWQKFFFKYCSVENYKGFVFGDYIDKAVKCVIYHFLGVDSDGPCEDLEPDLYDNNNNGSQDFPPPRHDKFEVGSDE